MEIIAFLDGILPREEPRNDRNGEADGAAEEEETGDSNDSDKASQSGSEMDSQYNEVSEDLKFPDKTEKAHDDPSLGLFSRLAKELRDEIYDLCTQEKQYEVGILCGPLRFQVHAPLSNLRLVSKSLASEYEARAPANALLIIGKFRGGYTFQLGDSAPKQIKEPQNTGIRHDYKDIVTQYGDLKTTPFEVAGLRCSIPSPPHVLVNRRPTTPAGTFGLDLRFWQDPRSDLLGFRRVFDDLRPGWTPGSPRLRVGPGALLVHDVNFRLKDDWNSQYYSNALPVVGKWTPEGGVEFNKVVDGTLLGQSEGEGDTLVERHDAGL